MSRQYEFCPECGSQVFDKEGQSDTLSKWDRVFICESCETESKISQTVALIEEVHQGGVLAGQVKLRYLQFPRGGIK